MNRNNIYNRKPQHYMNSLQQQHQQQSTKKRIIDPNDPSTWGPAFWEHAHTVAAAYPSEQSKVSEETKQHHKNYFESFANVLPCSECRSNWRDIINNKLPLTENDLEDCYSLSKWLLDAHNIVNKHTESGITFTISDLCRVYPHLTEGMQQRYPTQQNQQQQQQQYRNESSDHNVIDTDSLFSVNDIPTAKIHHPLQLNAFEPSQQQINNNNSNDLLFQQQKQYFSSDYNKKTSNNKSATAAAAAIGSSMFDSSLGVVNNGGRRSWQRVLKDNSDLYHKKNTLHKKFMTNTSNAHGVNNINSVEEHLNRLVLLSNNNHDVMDNHTQSQQQQQWYNKTTNMSSSSAAASSALLLKYNNTGLIPNETISAAANHNITASQIARMNNRTSAAAAAARQSQQGSASAPKPKRKCGCNK